MSELGRQLKRACESASRKVENSPKNQLVTSLRSELPQVKWLKDMYERNQRA